MNDPTQLRRRTGVRDRVVLDTNVLISAYNFGGKPKQILELGLNGAIVVLLSGAIRTELTRIQANKFFWTEA